MELQAHFIKGTCKSFCPEEEYKMYFKNNVECMYITPIILLTQRFIHFRRKDHNLSRLFETSFHTSVKCYSRSAAGQSGLLEIIILNSTLHICKFSIYCFIFHLAARSKNIRDLSTLESTTDYLFKEYVIFKQLWWPFF